MRSLSLGTRTLERRKARGLILVVCMLVLWACSGLPLAGGQVGGGTPPPAAPLSWCSENPTLLCLVSFGVANRSEMLIRLFVPTGSTPDLTIKLQWRDTLTAYPCVVAKDFATDVYCQGPSVPLGSSISLSVYATQGNALLARGDFLVNALALPTVSIGGTLPATSSSPLSTVTPLQSVPLLPTPAVAPTSSPTAIISPTPRVPQVTPTSVNVNCRSGPDVLSSTVSVLILGETAQIAGRNDDSSWWYIHDPADSGQFCWVAASVVAAAGDLAGLPVIAPATIVTQVTVDVALLAAVRCGGPNAMDFSGTITTNGAAGVTFQWEVQGDQSTTASPETVYFSKAETKDVDGAWAYKADCGKYVITLHVLSPNDISATKKFTIAP